MTMVSYCCVTGCNNNSNNVTSNAMDITFHEIPSKPELKQQWLQAICRPQWDPPSYTRICSTHFDADQMYYDGSVQIKEEACPLNALPKSLEASNMEICIICLAMDVKMFTTQSGILKQCIETLSLLSDKHSVEDFPHFVCYECGAQLLKYYRLIEKSITAQATLRLILEENGHITKPLVRQKDRKQLNLQSSLGYAEPSAVIAIENIIDKNVSLEYCSDTEETYSSDLSLQKNVCEKEFKNLRKRNLRSRNKSRKDKNNIFIKCNKNSKKSISVIQKVTQNKTIEVSVALKSEATESDIENIQSYVTENDVILKESDKPIHNTLKVELENPECKVEKFDSDSEDFTETLKVWRESNEKSKNVKPEKNEGSDYDDNAENNDCRRPIVKSSKAKGLKYINTVSCGNNESEGDFGSNTNLKHTKQSTNDSSASKMKSSKTPRKKKANDNLSPQESAIGKLKCYKIVNLSLQDQIIEWKKENAQPTHYRDQVFQCEVCTQKFLRRKAYEQHLDRHKPSRGDVECPVCKERFQSNTRLTAHTTRTHAKRYECTKCPKVFYNLIRARRHEIQHSGQTYTCPHCPYSTRHRSAVWEHARRQHPHDQHCAVCGHAFINAKGLAMHRTIAHPDQVAEPKEPHPCAQCDIVFHSEGALRVHQFTSKQHGEKEPAPPDQPPKLSCKQCGASFSRRRALWAHAQTDHNWVPRPTLRKRGVPLDLRTCEHCNKEVKTRLEYWSHLKREHPKLKHTYRRVVTAVCDKCGKGFYNASLLKVHALSHGSAQFACTSCPRVFHDRQALLRHAYTHTPERPYPCDRCPRAFKLKGNLERHMRTHTGETPYECSFCGKKFKYWGSMNEHEKHMHQKIPWPPRDRQTARPKKGADYKGTD